jgi:WD40 repeat protein
MAESETPKPAAPQGPRLEKKREFKLPTAVLALAVVPDGSSVLAACLDGQVLLLDPENGSTRPLGRHESYASGVVLLPDNRTVVSSGYDGALLWHDLTDGSVPRRIQAHQFWSWDLAAARDGSFIVSVTGRYEAGGYRYEPAPETEPSVKVFDALTGKLRREWSHVPPVQAVAVSPDSHFVAAGNLMGEVRVWDVRDGSEVARFATEDLTSWGVIKSHHYLGGIFAMHFSPAGSDLYVCGMGPMRDPMAGNGVQRWIRFDWRQGKVLGRTAEGESGQGLMEALAFHPDGKSFVMAGRLFQGSWNLALFSADSGKNLFSTDAKHRITDALWMPGGDELVLAKARQQEKQKDGRWPEFGLVEFHRLHRG